MLKKNISLVMILFIPIFLHSEPVSLNQARAVAQNFINSRSLENYTIKTIDIYNKNNQDVFYYINFNPTGFIVISADNRIKPILAYSYDNSFLLDNSSPGIQWISDYYYEKQKIIIENIEYPSLQMLDSWNYYSNNYIHNSERDVSPLIQAEWNQDYPWNRECPEDSDGPGGHVYVGCVAIAAAQLMHYWQFPNFGNGSKSYIHDDYGELTVDFEYMTYDFNLMPNTYSSAESELFLFHTHFFYLIKY